MIGPPLLYNLDTTFPVGNTNAQETTSAQSLYILPRVTKTQAQPADEEKTPVRHRKKSGKMLRTLLQALRNLKHINPLLDIRYLSILVLIALAVFFGRDIYEKIGFTSTATPTLTETVTATATRAATDTPSPTATATSTATSTRTPVPPTDTSTPTITLVPPKALGDDWMAGCISTLWLPYPPDTHVSDRGDGCWKEPVFVFTAENGDLDFLAEGGKNKPVEVHGLFVLLPEKGKVTVNIQLKDLTNVDLWMGIFPEKEIDSQGLLMIVPAGDVDERVFAQKDPTNYETITSTSLLEQGNGFSISFTFTENSARSTVDPSIFFTNWVSIPSSEKWLFLGYKDLSGVSRIQGRFFSFQLR